MPTNNMSFSQRIDAGEHLTNDDLDKYVALWEAGPQDRPVSEFLGLTREEFAYLCMTGDDFDTVVHNIRLGRNEVISGEVVQE